MKRHPPRSLEGLDLMTSPESLLIAEGLEEAAQRRRKLAALDSMGLSCYLDKSGSVSALVEVEDLYAFVTDDMSDEQYRRYHNGS